MKRISRILNTPVVLGGVVPALAAWAVTFVSIAHYA